MCVNHFVIKNSIGSETFLLLNLYQPIPQIGLIPLQKKIPQATPLLPNILPGFLFILRSSFSAGKTVGRSSENIGFARLDDFDKN